jgi:molybdopterin converting factor small subunit
LIVVLCLGHIGTSVGAKEIAIDASQIGAAELVDRVREMSKEPLPGFNRYNTLVMVEDGEAFVAAGSDRELKEGQRVALIPFSHGG